MNPCELTMYISALANALACCRSDDDLALLAASLNQLGDTLATILAQRQLCAKKEQGRADSTTDIPV